MIVMVIRDVDGDGRTCHSCVALSSGDLTKQE